MASFVYLWNTNEDFRNSIKSIWNNIVSSVSGAIGKIKTHLDKLVSYYQPVVQGIISLARSVATVLGPVIIGIFQNIANTISTVVNVISDVIGILVGIFTGDMSYALESAKALLDDIGTGVVNFFTNVWQTIVNTTSVLLELFGTSWPEIFEIAKTIFFTFVEFVSTNVSAFLTMIGNAISGVWNSIVNFVKGVYDSVTQWFTDIISSVISWALDFVARGQKASSDFFTKVCEFLSGLPGEVYGFFSEIISDAIDWGSNLVSEGYDAASSFYNDVSNYISSLVDSIAGFFSDIISNTISWASDFVSKAGKAASDFYDDITSGMQQIPDAVYSIGSSIVEGLWNGISDMGGWLWGKVTGFASGIIGAMRSAVEVGSPSKLAEREVGRWLPPGIAVGFEKALPASMRKIEDSLNGAITDYNDNIKSFVIGSTFIDPSIVSSGMSGQIMSEMYWLLAQYIAEALRTAPIVNNVNVEMEDGDVIMDRERVGRHLAPVVSRVIATGGG